jgi:hypothetical protein
VRGSKPDGSFAKAHWSKLKLAKFEGVKGEGAEKRKGAGG